MPAAIKMCFCFFYFTLVFIWIKGFFYNAYINAISQKVYNSKGQMSNGTPVKRSTETSSKIISHGPFYFTFLVLTYIVVF